MPAPTPLAPESLFRRSFWLGRVDPRGLAALRIGLGALALGDLLDRLRDFHAFYTAAGIVAPPAHSGWLYWSIFSLTTNPGATLALFLAGLPIAVAFALGYRTRLAGALLWLMLVSLHNRNPHVSDGGDAVLQTLLFWSMFADLGARASADVRLGRRRTPAAVPAIGLRFLQLQVALIYAVTFLAKSGPSWRDGSAVYRAIASTDWGRGVAPLLVQHPGLCSALTWGTLLIEGLFPLLVLSPWRTQTTRAIAIGAGLALHAGIFLSMRVGIFSEVMPVSYLIFVPPSWFDRLGWRAAAADGDGPPAGRGAATGVRLALLGAQLALITGEQLATAFKWRLPTPIAVELTLVDQRQNWRMFAPDAPLIDVTWRAPGVLVDGTAVELTDSVIPQLRDQGGFAYSRWHRLRNMIITERPELVLPLGRYICRRWSARARARAADRAGAVPLAALESFELVARMRPTLGPAAAEPPREEVVLRQRCLPAIPPAGVRPATSVPRARDAPGGGAQGI